MVIETILGGSDQQHPAPYLPYAAATTLGAAKLGAGAFGPGYSIFTQMPPSFATAALVAAIAATLAVIAARATVARDTTGDPTPTGKGLAGRPRRGRSLTNGPTPFAVHESGALLHGTKADLAIGDLLVPGYVSNYEAGRIMNHVYLTETLDAAVWGAELAAGEGRGRIYFVEPTGALEDDPNVTNKKFPGNPTRSYRTREPVRVVGELMGWTGHTPAHLQARKDGLADLKRRGVAVIYD